MSSKFPWESLKAETLRALFRDIGVGFVPTREYAMTYLEKINTEGLEEVIGEIKATTAEYLQGTGRTKRKSVGGEGVTASKKPRRSDVAGSARTTRTAAAATAVAGDESPRRSARTTNVAPKVTPKKTPKKAAKGRARPRKSAPEADIDPEVNGNAEEGISSAGGSNKENDLPADGKHEEDSLADAYVDQLADAEVPDADADGSLESANAAPVAASI